MIGNKVTVTRDNFVELLALTEFRRRSLSKTEIDYLYTFIEELLISKGGYGENIKCSEQTDELNFMIPGTVVHLNLTLALKDKAQDAISAFLILLGIYEGDLTKITSWMIFKLLGTITLLKKEYGQLCVVEALSKSKDKTTEHVFRHLYMKRCKCPICGCQFLNSSGSICCIEKLDIEKTLEFLANKKVVQKENAVPPICWGIIV